MTVKQFVANFADSLVDRRGTRTEIEFYINGTKHIDRSAAAYDARSVRNFKFSQWSDGSARVDIFVE